MAAIGDIIERCLRFFGITKALVSAVVGKDCGCGARQETINQWGFLWQRRLAVPLYWIGNRWQMVRHGAALRRARMSGHYLWMAFRVLFWGP